MHRIANIRGPDEQKTVPSSCVTYARDDQTHALAPRIEASGTEYGRRMETILCGSDGVRTIIFPATTKTVRQGSFYEVASLRSAVLNDGLETLGTEEHVPDGRVRFGVFQSTGLRRVRLPATLKRIECMAFMNCRELKTVQLPDRLEHIGTACFQESALESV